MFLCVLSGGPSADCYDLANLCVDPVWTAPVESSVHVRAMNDPCIQSLVQ